MSAWKIAALSLAAIWGCSLLWFVASYFSTCRTTTQPQQERTRTK